MLMLLPVIFVEGFYDELFVRRIIELEKIPCKPNIVKYKEQRSEKIDEYMRSLHKGNIDFIFLADADPGQNNGISYRVTELKKVYPNLGDDHIVIVVPEIEGWYIAGLNPNSRKKLGIGKGPKPDECTKEKFKSILPKRSDNIDIRSKILEAYDITIARSNSSSFNTFIEKLRQLK